MKEIGKAIPILLFMVLILLFPRSVISQTTITDDTANTNVNQFVMPGGTGYGGTTTSHGDPNRIPRTWFNPMNLPGVSGPIYYGGPVRFGKELLDVGILIRFKPDWDSGFASRFAHNRPGKVNVSESIRTEKDSPSLNPSVKMAVTQPRSEKKLRDFRRSFEFLECYSLEGTDGADSAKLLGMVAVKAGQINADIGIIVNQGANFELQGKDSQQVIGFSPTLMGGGTGSVAGGALGFAFGWAQHSAKYFTHPFLVALLFKSTGVPYDWTEPPEKTAKPAAKASPGVSPPAVPPSSYNNNGNGARGKTDETNGRAPGVKGAKGARDVLPPKGQKLPYKRPSTSVLIQERQQQPGQ